MYLSLPLPSTTMRTITLTVLHTDGTALPFPVTVTVPKDGKCKDLVQALSAACCLRDDETFLVAEVCFIAMWSTTYEVLVNFGYSLHICKRQFTSRLIENDGVSNTILKCHNCMMVQHGLQAL